MYIIWIFIIISIFKKKSIYISAVTSIKIKVVLLCNYNVLMLKMFFLSAAARRLPGP